MKKLAEETNGYLIKVAVILSDAEPHNLKEAIEILSDNGYDVFTGD